MPELSAKDTLTQDHAELHDTLVARRYFATFDLIVGHLARVAAELETEGRLTRVEARLIGGYVNALSLTFRALSYKYLMTGRTEGPLPGRPAFDRHESGFPVAQELMVMANDAMQAEKHLVGMPSEDEIKDRMVRQIVGDLTIPTKLQFSLSQRLYYHALQTGGLFWARNDPQAQWLGEGGGRRKWLISWAVYDTQANLPVLYLMDVEDSGKSPLATSASRWPAVQAHLMAQSVGGLKLLTIAQGFDVDFDDIHPRRLRRIHLGPMHSASFTVQSGPISAILAEAAAPAGEDWALVWTVEDLRSEREETVKDGWFSTVPRQIWALHPVTGAETGATVTERMIILPERVFQVLAERNPPGLRDLRKFVVGPGRRLMPQR
ncbi:MAG: hypothetical protein ACT4OK_17990 [Gemmobacter sp.]